MSEKLTATIAAALWVLIGIGLFVLASSSDHPTGKILAGVAWLVGAVLWVRWARSPPRT